jgi:hypothetical protein
VGVHAQVSARETSASRGWRNGGMTPADGEAPIARPCAMAVAARDEIAPCPNRVG